MIKQGTPHLAAWHQGCGSTRAETVFCPIAAEQTTTIQSRDNRRMTLTAWVDYTRRHPSAILLMVQLAGMLLYPFIEGTDLGRVGFGVFGMAVLGVTIGMVRRTRGLTWVTLIIALPSVALLALQVWLEMEWLLPWSAALEAVFYFYAAGSLIAYMMADRRATTDELFAAGATFTLLAWGFAYLYVFMQVLQPGSFAAAVNPQSARSWTELLYMSFALLSSTGIGDVIPISTHARMLAAVEMFVGVMYLAAVVSRLIGLTLIERGGPPPR